MDFLENLVRAFSGESSPGPGWGAGPSEEILRERELRKQLLKEAYHTQYGPVSNIFDPTIDETYQLEETKRNRQSVPIGELLMSNSPPDYIKSAAEAGLRRDLVQEGPPSYYNPDSQDSAAPKVPLIEQDDPAKKDALEKLIAAGKQASKQREFMAGTTPIYEDYEKGIAVGGDPNKSKEEIIATIRAQAAKKAGIDGPSPGGGGFTTAEQSPELIMRQAANESWANQQPIRDAEFALTRGQVEKSPRTAEIARDTLSSMQKNQAIQREQAIQSSLVRSLGGGGGKIPFEKAMQLQAAGVRIPIGVIGMSRDDAIASFDAMIEQGGRDLAGINQLDAVGDPSVKNRVVLTRFVMSLADMYRQKVAAGMDPEEADRLMREEVARQFMESGFLNTNEMAGPPPGTP